MTSTASPSAASQIVRKSSPSTRISLSVFSVPAEDQHSPPPLSRPRKSADETVLKQWRHLREKTAAYQSCMKITFDHALFAGITAFIVLVVVMNGDAVARLNTLLAG
jgi:hypothetical protein